jgi:hypothetical protein
LYSKQYQLEDFGKLLNVIVLNRETDTVLRSGHGPAWGLENAITLWDPLKFVELFY